MNELKQQKVWVCWKYVSINGRKTKKPYAVTGIPTGTSADHSSEWVLYQDALAALKNPGNKFDGVGFIMPEGYFLLDVDHKDTDDPMVKELRALLPIYLERSPSGNGFHFYGKVDLGHIPQTWVAQESRWKLNSRYYVKNSKNGLELYIGGLTNRFATYTGNTVDMGCGAEGSHGTSTGRIADCTDAVLLFLDKYMLKPEAQAQSGAAASADDEKYITLTEDDIPDIVSALRSQKNGAKFTALFDDGDISAYGSASEADAALCALIAFRAGPNPELIDAVFRMSALYRSKWERADYSSSTVTEGIRACKGVFHRSLRVRPPFVLNDGKKDYVHPTLLADYVRKHMCYIFVREAMRGSYQKYVYENGYYQNYSDDMFKGAIKAFVADYDPLLLKMSVIDEAFKQLNTDLNYIPQTALNVDESLINFQNGLLDIRTMTLHPHDPSVLSTIQIPCDWNPAQAATLAQEVTPDQTVPSFQPTSPNQAAPLDQTATALQPATPEFDSYLFILTDGDAATQTLLLEFMGACISNVQGYRMKKALFLYGPGDTGKSQLKRLTERLLGSGNYTGIDLQQMEARFGTSSIYGRRLAGSSDMSFMTVNELNTFKKITGGDALFAEFKGQDSFEFIYGGLLWFCMNRLPKFGGDDGKWVYDRMLPVHCPNVVSPQYQDHKLLDKMYAERAGIVYKAVCAFRAVIERGYQFTEPQGVKDAIAEYKTENNTALEFFETCMQPRTQPVKRDDPFTVKKVYAAYGFWYDACYGKSYRKTKKEFYRAIADSLGKRYEDMITQNARGTVLRDYCPNPDVWDEYNLSEESLEEIRKWVE